MKGRQLAAAALLLAFAGATHAQIQLGLLDDFEAGPMQCTTDGWTAGFGSPNPPTAALLCGELDTCCLEGESAGGFGPGSRQAVHNESQWAGDYIAAGVNKIQMQAANASATETLNLRVGVTNGNSCYVSTDAIVLPPNMPGPAGLQFISFILDDTTMTSVGGNQCINPGADSLATVLSGVTVTRILSSATGQWRGDAIISTLQIDAIQSKADSDFDGINDDVDNCTDTANAGQEDTDGDGYGNRCDTDLNNDCITNPIDLGLFRLVFFSPDPDADFDSSGIVNAVDLGILRQRFFQAPGPGQGACVPPDAATAHARQKIVFTAKRNQASLPY